MDNHKDTKKTDIHSYGQAVNSNAVSLSHKPLYDFTNKKTEKLVTALYMVTDCMDTDDALKAKLRFLGVELLSDMYTLGVLSPMEKDAHISSSITRINELLSFVGIAATIGFISEMNSAILHREFSALISELVSYQEKDTHFTFTLNEEMFEVEKNVEPEPLNPLKNIIKDKIGYNGHQLKKTNQTALYPRSIPSPVSPKGLSPKVINHQDKGERTQKILSLIKDKKGTIGNEDGVSIKDISIAFTDCSEKTIQRELNSLVAKGSISKIGSKRWSRYQALS